MSPAYGLAYSVLWTSWVVAPTIAAGCDDLLPQADRTSLQKAISSSKLLVYGILHARCTDAAENALKTKKACFKTMHFDPSSPMWSYLKCLYPEEKVGDTPMHSYIWIGGEFVGNGFKLLLDGNDYRCAGTGGKPCLTSADLDAKLAAAKADLSCAKDCGGFISEARAKEIDQVVSHAPVVLYGWNGCPCTDIARVRFQSKGVCYVENVWSDGRDPVQQYLQCLHGDESHSFVWIGGKFVGNGFLLDPHEGMNDKAYQALLDEAHPSYMCQKESDKSLLGGPLKSCTQDNDGTTTGWTRTGSCVWDPSDAGYHQVCVTMSHQFLQSSAEHDDNDLSSVVQEGGHWCICAWAWAGAVSRDPVTYEGIQLDCERTNAHLRNVYELYISQSRKMESPSGAHYAVEQALEQMNKVCVPNKTSTTTPTTSGSTSSATSSTTIIPEVSSASTQKTSTGSTGTDLVTLSITMKNVEFFKLDEVSKGTLANECKQAIALQARVSKSAVSVTLSPGSLIINAEIRVPEGQSASSVQAAVKEGGMSGKILIAAQTIQGVQDAATGEIDVTPVKSGSGGVIFKASDETQDSNKTPDEVTKTKATEDPSSIMTSAVVYPSTIIACVISMLLIFRQSCRHKSSTFAATSISARHGNPLVTQTDGMEMTQIS